MVRCKFRVTEKAEREFNPEQGNTCNTVVKLYACQGEPFGKYTPAGSIEMVIMNKVAADDLKLGKEYYVDFTLTE